MEKAALKNNFPQKKWIYGLLFEGSISARFRNFNTALFTLAFIFMIISMLAAFNNLLHQYSADFVRRYAVSSAGAFSAHIAKEISLISKAAHSSAVIEWLADERNEDKKRRAFEELSGIVGELHSFNLYIGVEKSFNEYKIEQNYTETDTRPCATLAANNSADDWYFDCIASDSGYLIQIGIDAVMQRKRVWFNYKVVRDGVPLGVIATGLDFSHITEELYSQYDSDHMRSLIIDGKGIICMDSSLLRDTKYLHSDFEATLTGEFSDPVMLATVDSYLNHIGDALEESRAPAVVKLSGGPHRFMAIAPIRLTNWSSVILSSGLAPDLNMSMFLPVFGTILLLLIVYAVATNAISHRLIFSPLEHLISSLAQLNYTKGTPIYGIDRKDEFGKLSNTIQDLFTKANYDALTGIYNRRFMESSLNDLMGFLSRSNSFLSILMIDVDYFKLYNDTYGHDQGDVCLKAVAKTLARSVARADDFAARYGGEEFVIVLPHATEAGACLIAEKLLENIRGLNLPHAKSSAAEQVTVSAGVMTTRVAYSHKWDDYLKCADQALYISKQTGRNRYTHHNYP